MGVPAVIWVIVALVLGRAVGFWLAYKAPVYYISWMKFLGVALLLGAGIATLYVTGSFEHLSGVIIIIGYGVLMLVMAAYTIWKAVGKPTKGESKS